MYCRRNIRFDAYVFAFACALMALLLVMASCVANAHETRSHSHDHGHYTEDNGSLDTSSAIEDCLHHEKLHTEKHEHQHGSDCPMQFSCGHSFNFCNSNGVSYNALAANSRNLAQTEAPGKSFSVPILPIDQSALTSQQTSRIPATLYLHSGWRSRLFSDAPRLRI